MKTPIFDFVNSYIKSDSVRLHMPAHKGASLLGCEPFDITEIDGADSLYEASGIIKESEENASSLFGCESFYSTEGSSHCIRAMLYLATLYAKTNGKRPLILAGRNAHKVFLSAAAMMNFEIEWLYGSDYLSLEIDEERLEKEILRLSPTALYLTSPDYLGNLLDIASISKICKRHGVLLLVDNAHGAYLKFLSPSLHPCDLGADICCDSAHKTLPVLTGGAYLHIKEESLIGMAKNALSLFGSTSPSYLILESLDLCNKYIADGFSERICAFEKEVSSLKKKLCDAGYTLVGSEPMKITLATKSYGYVGKDFAKELLKCRLVPEFYDSDFVVLMLCVDTDLELLSRVLLSIKKRIGIKESPPTILPPKRVMSPREAAFALSREINACDSLGCVLALASVACPPAVPIVAMGEEINESAIKAFEYYNIEKIRVIK